MPVRPGETEEYNSIVFLSGYIEYIARATFTKRSDLLDIIGKDDLHHIYTHANVNHCLSMEQHLYEFQERYGDIKGTYDARHPNPKSPASSIFSSGSSVLALIVQLNTPYSEYFNMFWEIHHSWIAEHLFNFNDIIYWQSPTFLAASWIEGELLMDELYG